MMRDEDQVKEAVRAALSVIVSCSSPPQLPLAKGETSGQSQGPVPAESDDVQLILSCFPQRRAVMWIQPADRSCHDDQLSSGVAVGGDEGQETSLIPPSNIYVRPLSPRTGALSHAAEDTARDTITILRLEKGHAARRMEDALVGQGGQAGRGEEKGKVAEETVAVKRVSRHGGPYQGLRYILSEHATPFTALLATMAFNGFTSVPARQALMDQSSWSLKWVKPPLRSEYVKTPLTRHQKINHIPGTRRLGHKGRLLQMLTEAVQRWANAVHSSQPVCGAEREDASSDASFHPRLPHRLFPESWMLPEDADVCLGVLRARENVGHLFIVKPCGGAGGRGIFLLRGAPTVSLPICQATGARGADERSDVSGSGTAPTHSPPPLPRQWVVQRYVSRPYLIVGHKFDLRLYVLVTSYWPLRLYLYQEGLVRIAAAPYYTDGPSASTVAETGELMAHLTNFTVNKSTPTGAAPASRDAWPGTKWSLAALAAYMSAVGDADYAATMKRVEDLLIRVFAAAVPEVRAELNAIQDEREGAPGVTGHGALGARGPACTFKGISPFFEMYGVDVLLERPLETTTSSGPAALEPVLMEVNIMPSLSTHYSRLDQSIKGHLVADALTVVGLSSPRLKPSTKPTLPVSAWPLSSPDSTRHAFSDTHRAFLASLTHVDDLEACMTAEDEKRRARLARFACLVPTCTSFQTYWPLLCASLDDAAGASQRAADGKAEARFDELLSAWECVKQQCVQHD